MAPGGPVLRLSLRFRGRRPALWDWKPEGWGVEHWKQGRGGAEMLREKGATVKGMERRRGGKGEKSGEEGRR